MLFGPFVHGYAAAHIVDSMIILGGLLPLILPLDGVFKMMSDH